MAKLHKVYAKKKPFAGLRFFKKCSDKNRFNIASRHFPWCRCWHWCLDITFHMPKFSRYYWKLVIWRSPSNNLIQRVRFRFGFFNIGYSRQFVDYQMLDEWFYEGQLNA